MASIYKRGKTWWIHYLVAGKSVSRSLGTTSERVAHEQKKKLEALDIIGQLAEPSRIPVAPFLQSFCEFLLATRTRKSAKNDISYLRAFFGPCCPALELGSKVPHKYRRPNQDLPQVPDKLKNRHVPVRLLEQISTSMVSTFIQGRVIADGISPKTANRNREVLHRMFSYAIEHHGYICPDKRYRNPVEGVKRANESAHCITWLDSDQIEEQIVALEVSPVIQALVSVYIYAGLRRAEALWLTHDDVDIDSRLIRIQAKTIGGEYWQAKTKRNRVIPMSDGLHERLSAYRSSGSSPWFFPSPRGHRWDPDNFSQNLKELNKAHGLSWTCLDFRHTFGSHLARNGVSLYKISALMGNSPEVCRRHYAALIPEEMTDVVEFEAATTKVARDGETKEMLQEILSELKGTMDVNRRVPNLRLIRVNDSA